MSTALPGSTELGDGVAYSCGWAWRPAEEPAVGSGVFGGSGPVSKSGRASGPASNGARLRPRQVFATHLAASRRKP